MCIIFGVKKEVLNLLSMRVEKGPEVHYRAKKSPLALTRGGLGCSVTLLELVNGLEPPTCALRMRCSTN